MRIHIFQHVPYEDEGNIGRWARANGHTLSHTRFFAGETPPEIDEYDWLMVLGGPMGANDERQYPWLAAEKLALVAAISGDKRVLGICLGAQLIASVLGARVMRNGEREVGWHPVMLNELAVASPLFRYFPAAFFAFHWHTDTFDLPVSAVALASSDACANQAFAYGSRVLALQFHLETTRQGAAQLVKHCPDDLQPGRYVQRPEVILGHDEAYTEVHGYLNRLLDTLARPSAVLSARW